MHRPSLTPRDGATRPSGWHCIREADQDWQGVGIVVRVVGAEVRVRGPVHVGQPEVIVGMIVRVRMIGAVRHVH
jgi:hypothetical protein